MNIPVLVLLGFAAWTLLTLFGSVGVYRWSRIITGRVSIAAWRADVMHGCEWYKRAMRAHMNCVENLPIDGALVVALSATGLRSSFIDGLSIAMLVARIGQTLVHILLPPSTSTASLRFALFLIQVICMSSIGITIAATMAR